MFAYMAQKHLLKKSSGFVWFLVHRQELIDQTVETFKNNNIDLNNIMIAMVQTVSRHIADYKEPSLIIFDEAHHSTAKTWTNIINAFPNVPIVGLTATPCRLDGSSLGFIYDDMQIGVNAKWLIEHKYLAPYKYYAPDIKLDTSNWKLKGSDYDQESVVLSMDNASIYGDIINCIDLNKKTIIYAPNIKYSIKLQDEINKHFKQVICKHFDGNTNKLERKEIINNFRTGKIKILTNVDLIGEGFDVPDCESCILLRPTMSTALYIQQSMRCMRYKDNKVATIYDLVGNCYKHGLPDSDRSWSLTNKIKTRNPSGEKDILVRTCNNCYLVYAGNNRICPYCNHDNGKTRKEIEEDRKAELKEITELERKKERREVGMCRTFGQLVELGRKRGYKNPAYWANMIMNSRKLKNY